VPRPAPALPRRRAADRLRHRPRPRRSDGPRGDAPRGDVSPARTPPRPRRGDARRAAARGLDRYALLDRRRRDAGRRLRLADARSVAALCARRGPERGGVARRALAARGVPVRYRTLRGGRDRGHRVAVAVARDGAFGDGAELEPALGVADAPRGGAPPRAAQPLPRPAGLLGCGRTRSPR